MFSLILLYKLLIVQHSLKVTGNFVLFLSLQKWCGVTRYEPILHLLFLSVPNMFIMDTVLQVLLKIIHIQ